MPTRQRPRPTPTAASTELVTTVPAATITTAAATTTSVPGGTPDELADRWVGPPRTIGNLGTGTAAAFVDISDGFVVYETGIAENPKAFSSDLAATGTDTIELKLVGDLLDCVDGDVGHYRWSLSPQATTLTLSADDDACAARQAAFEGQWTHTACKLEGRDCLGIVEAGTYSTNRWNPYGEFTYGQATFTLPDGWAVTYDSQAALFIGRAQDYADNPDPAPWGLRAWADVAAAAPDSYDCDTREPTDQPDPTIAPGATSIADWLVALPTLNSTRSTLTISGMQAEVVDAEVADDAVHLRVGHRAHRVPHIQTRPVQLRDRCRPAHADRPHRRPAGAHRRHLPRRHRRPRLRSSRKGRDAHRRIVRVLTYPAGLKNGRAHNAPRRTAAPRVVVLNPLWCVVGSDGGR